MQIDDFFSTASRAVPAPTRTVKFRLLGRDPNSGERLVADATAELAFIDEETRLDALRLADQHIKAKYNGEPPSGRRFDEDVFFLLACAMRDPEHLDRPFAETALRLRNGLTLPEALRLHDEYQRFVREEFPDSISPEEERELVEAAKKKSLLALLSEHGSSRIRSAWRSLVEASGSYQTPTSSDSGSSA